VPFFKRHQILFATNSAPQNFVFAGFAWICAQHLFIQSREVFMYFLQHGIPRVL
jgi:hypothetical protein